MNKNKNLVVNFFEMTFNQHQPRRAASKYLSDKYIQHNPTSAEGVNAFIEKFERFFESFDSSSVQIKRVIAEGDMVVLHVLSKKNPGDKGEAVAEFFRIQNNRIVEHWDVIQAIPEAVENDNGMF